MELVFEKIYIFYILYIPRWFREAMRRLQLAEHFWYQDTKTRDIFAICDSCTKIGR